MVGPVQKSVTVLSNDPVNPSIQLFLQANFETYLDIKPNAFIFGRIDRDRSRPDP